MKRWREQDRKRLPELLERYGAVCWYCHQGSATWTVDHIIPLSILARQEKPTYPRPIALACSFCNAAKQNKLPDEFYQWIQHIRSAQFHSIMQTKRPVISIFERILLCVSNTLTKYGLL